MNQDDIYDVSSYTEAELFEIMGLVNPSDELLESTIVKNIDASSGKLKRFFNDVYAYFFDIDDSDTGSDTDDAREGFATNTGNKAEIRKKDGSLSVVTADKVPEKGTVDVKEFTLEQHTMWNM
jgi:hypothetical protein